MKRKININGELKEYEILERTINYIKIKINNKIFEYDLIQSGEGKSTLAKKYEDKKTLKQVLNSNDNFQIDGLDARVQRHSRNMKKSSDSSDHHMKSPMPGKILKVLVSIGDSIKKNDPLVIMEAMKMEHTIKANSDGKVSNIHFKEGDQVAGALELIELERC